MGKAADFQKSLYGRPATVKTKNSLFINHVKPYLSPGVPVEVVHRVCRSLVNDDLSIGTVKGCMVTLAEYMKFTHGYEIDKKRLMNQYFSGKVRPPEKLKVWTKFQVAMALHVAEMCDPDLHVVMEVALGTGMRRGEIFGLKWDDVDFIDGYISVSRSLDISSGEEGPTKNKKARRIQMSDRVAKILEKSYTVGDEGFVFKTYFDPTPRLQTIARASAIPVITFHDLRHTFATTCFERGLSPKWVSAMLGHSKLSTTLDIYWQCFDKKENMEGLYD